MEGLRVVIATTQVPFVRGGAEVHAENLKKAILEAGHECEIVAVPFKWYPPEKIIDHMVACRLLDITESNGQAIDRMIGLRFPAYLIPHPNKVLWILHQFRTAYELWDTELCDLIHFPNGRFVRDVIRMADNNYIPEAKAIYTNSLNVSKRLQKYNRISSKPLYHPPPNADRYYCDKAENYIFFPSRLTEMKRQELAIRAMEKVKSHVKLLIAGNADQKDYELYLKKVAKECKVLDRVKFLGDITEEDKIMYYAKSLAVMYPPVDEDYGYVTLEAMLSGKPVITCTDSGGPLEFISDEENGLVCEPDPEALAEAMDKLMYDKQRAYEMGQNGKRHYQSMNITWEKVVEVLLK